MLLNPAHFSHPHLIITSQKKWLIELLGLFSKGRWREVINGTECHLFGEKERERRDLDQTGIESVIREKDATSVH